MSVTYRHLIREAQKGDATAMETTLEMFGGLIWRMVSKYNKIFKDLDEAWSIGKVAIVEGIFNYDFSYDRPVPLHMWANLRKGFNREARRMVKQDKHVKKDFYDTYLEAWSDYPGGLIDWDELSPDEIYVMKEKMFLLTEGLTTLTSMEKKVLELCYEERCSGVEIASRLGLHRNTVSLLLRKAKTKLFIFLEERSVQDEACTAWNSIVESKGRVYRRNAAFLDNRP